MRVDLILFACGGLALALYFTGFAIPSAIVVTVGVALLVWTVLMRR
jgi:hypothetical protein